MTTSKTVRVIRLGTARELTRAVATGILKEENSPREYDFM